MPFWKTGAAMSRVTTVVTAALLCVSCGPAEQGYWTKHGVSQALTNEQFPADSQHCERFAAQNDGRYSDKAREKRYTKCMSAREYQWVVEEPVSLPDQSRGQSTHAQSCPAGYTNCIPGGTKGGGLNPEVNQSITREDSSHQNPALLPPNPSHQSNEQRLVEDRECRQQADATLSSPYGVYVTCMQEKGWSSPPAGGATADSVENEQPDHNKGHAQEDIGLQSAARNIGDEIPQSGPAIGNMFTADSAEKEQPDPNKGHTLEDIGRGLQSAAGNIGDEISKIGSAIGNMFTADSAEKEQPDPNKGHTLEDFGRGLQSAARNIENEIPKIGSAIGNMFTYIGRGLQSAGRNIGDEIPKIGPAIGNMFKQLGDKDTRDKDKEKASNRLGCATPQACPARHAAKSSAPPSAFTLKRKVKDQEKRIVELTTQLEMLKQIDHSRTKER